MGSRAGAEEGSLVGVHKFDEKMSSTPSSSPPPVSPVLPPPPLDVWSLETSQVSAAEFIRKAIGNKRDKDVARRSQIMHYTKLQFAIGVNDLAKEVSEAEDDKPVRLGFSLYLDYPDYDKEKDSKWLWEQVKKMEVFKGFDLMYKPNTACYDVLEFELEQCLRSKLPS